MPRHRLSLANGASPRYIGLMNEIVPRSDGELVSVSAAGNTTRWCDASRSARVRPGLALTLGELGLG